MVENVGNVDISLSKAINVVFFVTSKQTEEKFKRKVELKRNNAALSPGFGLMGWGFCSFFWLFLFISCGAIYRNYITSFYLIKIT